MSEYCLHSVWPSEVWLGLDVFVPGLQHQRCTAMHSLILSLKRCIEYTSQGVWVRRTEEPVKLPRNITSMYENCHLHTKMLQSLLQVCCRQSRDTIENGMTHFLYRSSPNTCKERIKDEASIWIICFTKNELKHNLTNKKLGENLLPIDIAYTN